MFRKKRPDAKLQCARVLLYGFFVSAAALLVVFFPSITPISFPGKTIIKRAKISTQTQQDISADTQQAAKKPAGAAATAPADKKVKIELFIMSNCPGEHAWMTTV